MPGGEKLLPVRRADLGELRLDEVDFRSLLGRRQFAPQATEAVIDQVGVDDIGFAVIANLGALAGLPGLPDLAAVHAELAGKTVELGQVVERRVGARVVEGEQIHQVEMAHVVATDVVVPLEITRIGVVAIAQIPVARRADAMQHAAIVQHRRSSRCRSRKRSAA